MLNSINIFFLSLAVWQASALAGGRNSNQGEYPGFVGIVLPTSNQVCGASIFNRNHVLTVANCMLNANNMLLAPNQISIIAGDNTINFGRPRTQVQAIYVHPQYNPFTFENDIAVVRTQTDFNFPQVPTPLVAPIYISTRIG
jgi:trypsin